MKKLLAVALGLVLVFAFAAMAQDEGGKLSYGFKAGLGMCKWTGSSALDTALISIGAEKKNLMGFGGGGVLAYKLTPSVVLQFEALYLMKGVKYTLGDETAKFKLSYIEIPVTLHVAPNMQGSLKPNFFAGPFLGLLASAKLRGESGGMGAEVDVKDFFKSTEFGVTFGAGFDYVFGTSAITFDARYDLGLSKVWDDLFGFDSKNGGFFLMVGYKLGY